jgi:hypothetical protein
MSALTGLAGLSGPLFKLIDSLFTTEDERQSARLKVLELAQKGELAQLAVNAAEAQHDSLFVAGWRPFIGWVCGLAFGWAFLVQPLLSFILAAFGVSVDIPVLDLSAMMPVLMGMLGLGAMRSWEKKEGVARETINPAPTVDRRARPNQ